MKTILLLLITVSFCANAQNWSLIHNNLTTYYKYNDKILMLKSTSRLINNSQTVYFPKRVEELIYGDKNDKRFELSWFGHNYVHNTNGKDAIITYRNSAYPTIAGVSGIIDSIYFNTLAKLGESWRFTTQSSGDYSATITGVGLETFLGISDSVKVIQVSLNNTLAGIFKLSKKYGMIKTYTFNCFPNIEPVTLTGIQNVAGFQDFGEDIYNFNIGDEFQIREGRLSLGESYLRYIDRKILNKSQTSSTFTYQIQDIFCRSTFTNSSNFLCSSIDTNIYSKTYSKTDDNGFLIPSSPSCNNLNYFDQTYTLDSSSKSIITNVLDNYITNIYKKGVGLYYRGFYGQGGSSGEAVIYYKNSKETVGAKTSFILTNLDDKLVQNSYKIAPNFASGLFTFYKQGVAIVELNLYNTVGQEIWKQNNIRGEATEINVLGNPTGIYLLKISSESSKPVILKMVIE